MAMALAREYTRSTGICHFEVIPLQETGGSLDIAAAGGGNLVESWWLACYSQPSIVRRDVVRV